MKANKIVSIACLAMLFLQLISFVGCGSLGQKNDGHTGYASFKDIPGVTAEEISAIETLITKNQTYIYGMGPSTEAFYNINGEIQGYSALVCEWLSGLFGLDIRPALFEWGDLIEGLQTHQISFTGELTATEERRKSYHMTGAIAQREVAYMRLEDSVPLDEIRITRPLRYGFLDDSMTSSDIAVYEKGFESVFVMDYDTAYQLLVTGEIDAFFDEAPAVASFDQYKNVIAEPFFPLIYSPVSLSTRNNDLLPVITVVQKALDHGEIRNLTKLYSRGHRDYLVNKLKLSLTEEEIAYIAANPVIKFTAAPDNYPVSFYNSIDEEWQGVVFEVLDQISGLTGIQFELVAGDSVNWLEILELLRTGEVKIISELIYTESRAETFIWPEAVFFDDQYALLSKTNIHNYTINEIFYEKIGLVEGTAYTETFQTWFPDHQNTVSYKSINEGFDALIAGDINLLMASKNQLLTLTNLHEQPGYMVNLLFNKTFGSTFGLYKDEVILRSILDKTLKLIDLESIAGHWLTRTYDYQLKLTRAQLPINIGVSVLLVVMIFMVVILQRNRNEGKRLEKMVHDRTDELYKNQQKLEVAVEEAQAANRTKSAFLANMSHEIRTPMNAIIGMSELLTHENLNERQVSHVNDINLSAHNLLSIINDILDMSKIESGKLELQEVNYNFFALTDNMSSMFQFIAEKKGLEFIYEKEGDIPHYLFGDDVRLRQIITNICANAVKFTEKGFVCLKVTATSEELIFDISDSGKGIREEDISKLFVAFQQTNDLKNHGIEGTGLGLSIAKSFAVMMGGDITVSSEYGKGTTFTVRIPLAIGEEVVMAETAMKEEPFYAPLANILVVDDNEFNLKVAGGLLKLFGIDAVCVNSGIAALELLKEKDFDIIFMDHMMPDKDGVETTQDIRKLGGKYVYQTIIALTANAIRGSKEMFLENGFNGFVSKPIEIKDLTETLRAWLSPAKIVNRMTEETVIEETVIEEMVIEEMLNEEKAKIVKKPEMKEEVSNNNADIDKEDFLEKIFGIGEINVETGLRYASGMQDIYYESLQIFFEKVLDECENMSAFLENGDIKSFGIAVHAMKSMLATIGATGLSERALKLEMAAKEGNGDFCQLDYPDLEEELHFLADDLAEIFPAKESNDTAREDGSKTLLLEKLEKTLVACTEFDNDVGVDILKELQAYDFGEETNGLISESLQAMKDFDIDGAEVKIKKIIMDNL